MTTYESAETSLSTLSNNPQGLNEGVFASIETFTGTNALRGFSSVELRLVDQAGDPLPEAYYITARDGVPATAAPVTADSTATINLRNGVAHTDFIVTANYPNDPRVDYAWFSVDEQEPIFPLQLAEQDEPGVVVVEPAIIGSDGRGVIGIPIGDDSPQDMSDFTLELKKAGESITIVADEINDVRATFEHTAIDSWEVDVPYSEQSEAWKRADATIRVDGEVLLTGIFDKPTSDEGAGITTLTGRGAMATLKRGGTQEVYRDKYAWVAIEDYWDEHTPFEYEVVAPSGESGETLPVIESEEYVGSHFENLQKLHEAAGMRWAVEYRDLAEGPKVYSFKPDDFLQKADWTSLSSERAPGGMDYANVVTVYGAAEGDAGIFRLRETVADQGEIDAVGERVPAPPVFEPKVNLERRLRAIGRKELRERIATDRLSGSVEIVAQPIIPGPTYPVPELDGVELALESVDFSLGTGTLEFQQPENLASQLTVARRERRKLREEGGEPDPQPVEIPNTVDDVGVYGGSALGDSAEGG